MSHPFRWGYLCPSLQLNTFQQEGKGKRMSLFMFVKYNDILTSLTVLIKGRTAVVVRKAASGVIAL